MTRTKALDPVAEAAAMTAALAARRDPSYEWGMRRTVPSAQPAHATRVPDIRRVAADWSRTHRDVEAEDVVAVSEALWATGWREERIAAIALLGQRKATRALLEWPLIERWTGEIDNWEHVDNLASLLAGPMLVGRPELAPAVRALAASEHPWRRRAAVVTLLEAAREDQVWALDLETMTGRLSKDPHPLVRKAVVWARRVLAELEARQRG